jgi:hypothetical protein
MLMVARVTGVLITGSVLVMMLAGSVDYLQKIVLFPDNRGGIASTISNIKILDKWRQQAGVDQATYLIFTPSYQTAHYDYLTEWYSRSQQAPVPFSQKQGHEQNWFLMMEEDHDIPEKRFYPWYQEATASGVLVERVKTQVLTLEWWQKDPELE